jgi:hypothetical protein
MDTLIMLSRREQLQPDRLADSVGLMADPENGRRFQVVIDTYSGEFIERELSPLAPWLGVSIAVQAPWRPVFFWKRAM